MSRPQPNYCEHVVLAVKAVDDYYFEFKRTSCAA